MGKKSVRKRLTKKKCDRKKRYGVRVSSVGANESQPEDLNFDSSPGTASSSSHVSSPGTASSSSHDFSPGTTSSSSQVVDHDYCLSSKTSLETLDPPLNEFEKSAEVNEQVSPSDLIESENSSILELLFKVKRKVELFLSKRWLVIVNQEVLHVVYFSIQKTVSVQRTIVVSPNGDFDLFVHGCPVKIDPYTQDLDPPMCLDEDSVNSYVDKIVHVVNAVGKMAVCSGYDELKYQPAWSSCPYGDIDRNPHFECRYVETFRSSSCKRLVPGRKWRCSECNNMYGPLKRITSAIGEEQRHSYTKNALLTEDQKLKKLERQKVEIDKNKKTIRRYQARVQELLKKEGKKIDIALADDLTEILEKASISPAQSIFLQQQIKASQQKNACGMRWHPTMIRFALSLHLTSPAAYELVRQTGMVQLPSSRTLFDYSHVKPAEEGVDRLVLDSLEERNSKLEKKNQYHVLMADELYISQNLVFQKSSLRLIGYTSLDNIDREVKSLEQWLDKPEEDCPETVATKVLVYMVKGVSNGFKEVVATYAVGNLTAHQLYTWTWKVIGALERSNIPVIAFVSDGSAVNRAFIRKHKPATPNKYGIVFDTVNRAKRDRKLYFIADVPHLLKTVRNCFLNSRWDGKPSRRKMVRNKKRISWDFIIKLYESQKGKNLRKSFKLSPMNVYPDSYARMKVKLAGQVLSRTVSKDLRAQGWADASETASFIELVNDWFDCLNGAHSSQAQKTRNVNLGAYTSLDDPRFQLLEDFLNYLDEWETEANSPDLSINASAVVNVTCNGLGAVLDESEIEGADFNPTDDTPISKRLLSKETLEGIRITTMAFKPLITFLLGEGVSFINARVFSQDPLEQHFSKVRAGQGGSTNPNVMQVLNRNRAIHTIGQLGMRKRKGNSAEESNVVKVTTAKLPKRMCKRNPKFS